MRLLLAILVISFFSSPVFAKVKTEQIRYQVDGNSYVGFIAYDDKIKGKRPGILVVHEWWGHNDYTRSRAKQLAELGYTALALDMYGDGKTASHPKQAGEMAMMVKKNMAQAQKRFEKAMSVLSNHDSVDQEHIAAIGYCFGGGIVLEMARRGLDLDAVASFHGSLATSQPAAIGSIKAKVLVLNGADDPFVKESEEAAFKQEMSVAGVDYKFINYPGAVHAFTNPAADKFGKKFKLPLAYNAEADKKSWDAMKQLFKEALK